MPKKSGTTASRARRKQIRERQRRAERRGLPQSTQPDEARSARAKRSDRRGTPVAVQAVAAHAGPTRRWPTLAKVAVFVVLLIGGLWLVAQLRQERGTRTSLVVGALLAAVPRRHSRVGPVPAAMRRIIAAHGSAVPSFSPVEPPLGVEVGPPCLESQGQ